MSFFTDAIGDHMISGGTIKVTAMEVYYEDGEGKRIEKPFKFKAKKSCQPLYPEEAQLMGFGDYGTNEFLTIYALQEIPMPSNKLVAVKVHFNKKDWYVRKVLPWVWNQGTPFEYGYWEVTLSRFNETEVNPNGSL